MLMVVDKTGSEGGLVATTARERREKDGGGTLVGEELNGEGRGVCAATDLVLFEVVRDGEGEGGTGEDGGVATAVAGSGEKRERRRGLLAAGGLRETWRFSGEGDIGDGEREATARGEGFVGNYGGLCGGFREVGRLLREEWCRVWFFRRSCSGEVFFVGERRVLVAGVRGRRKEMERGREGGGGGSYRGRGGNG
ncbi:hypothetical protein HAX54_015921 [Datura stramonium]|uniref:Uncharacterized protein n=1 Tax=Datura stramonium TaxID=4076 RepID=A0ABS8UIR5_DATST|nr:hypothetical protein [Datura stramonium]